MRPVIRQFDAFIRWCYKVYDFCEDEDCLLRLQVSKAPHDLNFDNQTVKKGEPVLGLHLWNEHMPPIPVTGPDLSWAKNFKDLFIQSLHAVADQIMRNPSLSEAQAIGGSTILIPIREPSGSARLMHRLGFTIFPYQNPVGRFGEFWENFYTWWIIWTYNPGSTRYRRLINLRRQEIWMTIGDFLKRYGEEN